MKEHRNLSPEEPRSYRLVSLVLDRILARARWLLFPIALASGLGKLIHTIFWLLCNEHAKSKFADCGDGVRIYGRFTVTAPGMLEVGDNVHINSGALFRAEGGLSIGDNVHIGRNLLVYTINHNYEGANIPYDNTVLIRPVTIERNVWIGAHVVIAPGVTIGEGAIVGMGSVIAKDVERLSVVGAASQRNLKTRNQEHYDRVDQLGHYGAMSGYRYRGKKSE